MKTILGSIILFCTGISTAQIPLLPLLKSSSQWQVNGSGGGNYISTSKKVYEVLGDSIIGSLTYQILASREEGCSQCRVCPDPIKCYKHSDTLFLCQIGNTLVKKDLDTLFSLSGTSVGDSIYIKGYDRTVKIIAIDSVSFGSQKRRAFVFPGFVYYDGIGFSTGGPVTCPFFEITSQLTCYRIDQHYYSYLFNECSGVFLPSHTGCISPLSLQNELVPATTRIYLNEYNELVHNFVADQIEIVNSVGQHVLSNQSAIKTDLSNLKSGVYVARLLVGTQVKSYPFLVP